MAEPLNLGGTRPWTRVFEPGPGHPDYAPEVAPKPVPAPKAVDLPPLRIPPGPPLARREALGRHLAAQRWEGN